jgi:hypothetical protein
VRAPFAAAERLLPDPLEPRVSGVRWRYREQMAKQEDTAVIAGQLADLTRTVERMASQLVTMRERADTQQERIDLAARELAEVSTRLQAAANALRESI